MFDNKRYITRGIETTIPLWLQNLIWYTIETMEVETKDYLQVFKLSSEESKQKIMHIQEEPSYEKVYMIEDNAPVSAKIYVIDDVSHSTMLLAEEY